MQYVDLIWIHIQINPVVKQTNKKTLHVLYNTKCSNTVWIFDDIRDTTFFCVCVWGGGITIVIIYVSKKSSYLFEMYLKYLWMK